MYSRITNLKSPVNNYVQSIHCNFSGILISLNLIYSIELMLRNHKLKLLDCPNIIHRLYYLYLRILITVKILNYYCILEFYNILFKCQFNKIVLLIW
jgi:hypothetical protein